MPDHRRRGRRRAHDASVRGGQRRPPIGRPVVVLLVAALVAVPGLVLTLDALSTRWFFPDALPRSLTLRHVTDVLGRSATQEALRTGLVVSVAVTAVALLLAWPASSVLARPRLPGRFAVAAVLVVPSLLPAVGLAIGIDVLALRIHVAGSTVAVVGAQLVPTLPYVVASLTAGFARHDRHIEAQAAVLGASDWQRLRLVTIPAMRRSIAVSAALGFVVSWSQYLLTVLVGAGRVVTITMVLFAALAGGNPSTVGVLALVTAVPAIGLLVVAARTGGGPSVDPSRERQAG